MRLEIKTVVCLLLWRKALEDTQVIFCTSIIHSKDYQKKVNAAE